MTLLAFPLAVSGNQQFSTNFNLDFPVAFSALCCITTITLDPLFTKSIAPPIPFAIFPGIIQFAISPVLLTWRAPNMVISRCPPLIIPNDSDDEKKDDPGNVVIVYLPALIKSASSVPCSGYGPTPNTPFSAWIFILTPGGRHSGNKVGIPIPKFTLAPSKTYLAALIMIFILVSFFMSESNFCLVFLAKEYLSIFFSLYAEFAGGK